MKIITSIYLNCRPELRNDWLVGVEADLEAEDQLVGIPQEHALRSLIAFYNKKNYAAHMAPTMPDEAYRRMEGGGGFLDHQPLSPNRRRSRMDSLSATSEDIFDATRDPSMPYNPDGMIEFWMHEYEDVLRDVFGDGTRDEWADTGSPASPAAPGPAEGRNDAAWIRLGELMRARGAPEDDTISDSESVVSVGELGEDARLEAETEGRTMFAAMQERKRRTSQGDENTWEVSFCAFLELTAAHEPDDDEAASAQSVRPPQELQRRIAPPPRLGTGTRRRPGRLRGGRAAGSHAHHRGHAGRDRARLRRRRRGRVLLQCVGCAPTRSVAYVRPDKE